MIEAAWRRTVARYGVEKESRIGYSIGLSDPPDRGERTMSFRAGDKSVPAPNTCVRLIPSIRTEDWSRAITESFLVTGRGAEPFGNSRDGSS